MHKYLDLTGQKFGKLTAILKLPNTKEKITWLCHCDCGNKVAKFTEHLRSGDTKSCGCLHKEIMLKHKYNLKHGLRNTRFYMIWASIKARCLNKNDKHYKWYGSRGITVCNRWLKFKSFRDDMYKIYKEHCKIFGEKNTTIERKNNNGNYCPENCIFATQLEQANNRRSNHLITFNGKTLNTIQWCNKLNLPYSTIRNRINRSHWSPQKALTTPVGKYKKSS